MEGYEEDRPKLAQRNIGNGLSPVKQFGFERLNDIIAQEEGHIQYLKEELKRKQANLKELQKARKLVTPEIEASVNALRKVGLV